MNVAPIKRSREPFNFDPTFERALVYVLCSHPRTWSLIGVEVEADCLAAPSAKLAIQAAAIVARERGTGPESTVVVMQRLRRWMSEGKVTHDQIVAVADYFDAAEDAGAMVSDEALLAEVVPILKRRMEREAIETGLSEYQRRGDVHGAMQRLEKAKHLGEYEDTVGVAIGPGSFEHLERLKTIQRLKSGILELDDSLGGGWMRGTLLYYLAPSGGGKSVSLTQHAAASCLQGFRVGVATLELPVPIWLARVKACLTGIPIDAIIEEPYACGAIERLDEIFGRPGMGAITVKSFTPKATTMGTLRGWIRDTEQAWGAQMDVLVVDYADKMRAQGISERAQDNSYTASGSVYEDMFVWARDGKRWAATASQSRRGDGKNKATKKLDIDDTADSMGKPRTADYGVSINLRDQEQVELHVFKNRLGRNGQTIGPLPTDFACARIAPFGFYDNDPYATAYDSAVALKGLKP